MKIVVAEDEILNQRLTMTLLRRLGHQVHCVSNGRELVDYLAHEHADLAFVDVHMPFMTGIEAAAEIVRRWRPSTRPVLIALSGSIDPNDVNDCLKAGMDGFLRKPVNAHELQETIDAWSVRKGANTSIFWLRPKGPLAPFPVPSVSRR